MLDHSFDVEEVDRALTALSDYPRRRLLLKLYEETGAGTEESINYTEIRQYQFESGSLQLYHIHLPKLESFGYINWNKIEQTIQKGPRWDEVEPFLDLIYTHLNELPSYLQGKGERE